MPDVLRVRELAPWAVREAESIPKGKQQKKWVSIEPYHSPGHGQPWEAHRRWGAN